MYMMKTKFQCCKCELYIKAYRLHSGLRGKGDSEPREKGICGWEASRNGENMGDSRTAFAIMSLAFSQPNQIKSMYEV